MRENLKERNSKIYELRLSGWTLQEIGCKYKMTRENVRRICVSVKYSDDHESDWDYGLSVRAKNCIAQINDKFGVTTYGKDDLRGHYAIFDLTRLRNVGPKTIREIEKFLGYTESRFYGNKALPA